MWTRFHLTAVLLLLAISVQAAKLNLASCVILGPDGEKIPAAADNRIDTNWTSKTGQRAGMAVTIDLLKPCSIHRIYLTPGARISAYPRALKLSVGATLQQLTPVLTQDLKAEIETNLKFNPAVGRYVKLEINGEGAGYPWCIAEMEIYGSSDPQALTPRDCVVLEKDTETLRRAAADLRYYVSELTGKPIPLVNPEDAARYPGTIYRVLAPAPLPDYAQFLQDERSQHLERASVSRQGREVLFNGTTELAVMYGVYEFLDRNGVKWVFPSAQGDYVPAGGGVKLQMLPFTVEPSFSQRYANWNTQNSVGKIDPYLWLYRNRWNSSWGGPINAKPGVPAPKKAPNFGYTHTFSELIPGDLYKDHPDWFPLFKPGSKYEARISGKEAWKPQPIGTRVPYGTTWGINFCTSNPEIPDYIAQKIIANADPKEVRTISWMVPMDAAIFCECDRCQALDDPAQLDGSSVVMSNRYLTLVSQVAEKVRTVTPNVQLGIYGYDTYRLPPSKFPTLPDNLVVDLVQNGVYNLPLSTSPKNRWWKDAMDGWAKRWTTPGHLGIYDWVLLHGEGKAGKVPVPCVTALADRVSYLYALGARRYGTQADQRLEAWRYNPWNYYACSRLAWNAREPAERILTDFFQGYYREAATPMLAYYREMETYQIANNVVLLDSLSFTLPSGAYTLPLLASLQGRLDEAAKAATSWVTIQRVAEAREGFNELIDRLGLHGVDLRKPDFPVVGGAVKSLPMNLAAGRIRPARTPEKSGGWIMWGSMRAGDYVTFTEPGAYRVTVRMQSWDQAARLGVNIGTQQLPMQVEAKTKKEFTVRFQVPAGSWEVSVQGMNSPAFGLDSVVIEKE